MALAINNNLMANNVTRNLQGHYGKLGQSTQRLSSGLRVSSAADDAAGLAIRELMRADIAALGQGVRNANDGISMIQTADGALGVIDSKLIRMKELAEQSSSDTYTGDQRKLINQEYQAMAKEITRIAEDTDFNGKKILNGSDQGTTDISRVATAGTATETVNIDGTKSFKSTAADQTVTYKENTISGLEASNAYKLADKTVLTVDEGKNTVSNVGTATVKSSLTTKTYTGAKKMTVEIFDTGTKKWTEVVPPATGADAGLAKVVGKDFRVTAEFGDGKKVVDTITNNTAGEFTVDVNAKSLTTVATKESTTRLDIKSEDTGTTNLHFGSSSAATDSYDIGVGNATATALGVGEGAMDDVLTAAKAKTALDNINDAIALKDGMRADLGSTQNRLTATIENISIQKENLQAAESRISDVDVATEMTEFNKQQILANAAISMLSQANNLPKMAQKLLG